MKKQWSISYRQIKKLQKGFSPTDFHRLTQNIVALLTDQDDYAKTRNYWKYLKAKLKKEKTSWLVPLPN